MGGYVREVVGESRPTGAKKHVRRKTRKSSDKTGLSGMGIRAKPAGLTRKGSGHRF
jgi:hypothetical protein